MGLVLSRRGETEEAVREWRRALALDPKHADAHNALGRALYQRGAVAEALANWREGIGLQPGDVATLRQVAWVLATCPTASLRNGSEAVALAVRALQLTGGRDAAVLDILAAAYAEAGRFADAALTAHRALSLIAPERQPEQAEALKRRIALYESQSPFREPPASTGSEAR